MSDKTLKGRIVQKHDTAENWAKAATFVPKAGELIIYDVDGEHEVPRFKVGDGVTVVGDLPFSCASQSGGGDSDYPQMAMIRVRVDVSPTDWTDNADGTVSVTISNSNISEQMSLLEWEADSGYDFPTKGKYETTDGYLILTLADTPTTQVSGYFTLGVDSRSIDPGTIGPNVVTSVNGMTGDVTLDIPQGNPLTFPVHFEVYDWRTDSPQLYVPWASDGWLQAECSCDAYSGDRFVCTRADGMIQGPVYAIPVNGCL